MHSVRKRKAAGNRPDRPIDSREQIYNGREVGPIGQVQIPIDNITSLHGVVYDLDINLLRPDAPGSLDLSGPEEFATSLEPILDRHPALRGAEIRCTGRNVHVIPWFEEPVEFHHDGERRRWAAIVEIVQSAQPIDPDQPGITALTRPVNSINGKTGKPVSILRPGSPVLVADVIDLYDRMVRAPFRTFATILLGSERVSPCPVCRAAGSTLAALDHVGRCYGSCGNVKLEQFYDTFLLARTAPEKGGSHAQA